MSTRETPWRAAVALHLALLAAVLGTAFVRGGADAVWTTSMWSGHDGMQHFRVAVDPFASQPITDNPIRYSRPLLPLAAYLLGGAAAPLFPAEVTIPHLGPGPGRMLATAWALLALVVVFSALAVREAGLLLGRRAAFLAAVCPLLLLSVTHCLAFPVLMWGTFRLFRRQGRFEVCLLALLPLVHGAALILPAAWALTPWLERGASMRRRLAAAGLAAACALPLVAWSLAVSSRPGFAAVAPEGAETYAHAAFRLVPGAGLVEGVALNLQRLRTELAAGDWLSAGARVARHGLLLVATALFALLPFLVRPPRPYLAYWALGVCLIAMVNWQVTAELDNLGRFLFVSPVVFLALLHADRERRLASTLAVAAFLAVDLNYAASFLTKVGAGGAGVAAGLVWW